MKAKSIFKGFGDKFSLKNFSAPSGVRDKTNTRIEKRAIRFQVIIGVVFIIILAFLTCTVEADETKTCEQIGKDLANVKFSGPEDVIENPNDKTFKCQERSILVMDYLRRKGYEVEFVDGNPNAQGKPTHSWLRVKCKNEDTDEWHIIECRKDPYTKAVDMGKEGTKDTRGYTEMSPPRHLKWDQLTKKPLQDHWWKYLVCEDTGKPVLIGISQTATSTGEAIFYPETGLIKNFKAKNAPKHPDGVKFPHGLFKYDITELTKGKEVVIHVKLPKTVSKENLEKGGYYKYNEGTKKWNKPPIKYPNWSWNSESEKMKAVYMRLKLTDGGTGDLDNNKNKVIKDPGGPGIPLSVPVPSLTPIGILILILLLFLVSAVSIKKKYKPK